MCGRFVNWRDYPETVKLYGLGDYFRQLNSNFPPRYNIAPTQTAPVIRLRDGKREIALLRWGLIPFWAKDMKFGAKTINAQSETADTKPAFREAWKARRCLVVANGFYEWPEPGKPRFITLNDDQPFSFAGLWDTWKQPDGTPIETFTILTTVPNEFMAEVHNRMPVILAEKDWAKWLGEVPVSNQELKDLCRPFPSERMTSWAVSKDVGNVKNDEPRLVSAL